MKWLLPALGILVIAVSSGCWRPYHGSQFAQPVYGQPQVAPPAIVQGAPQPTYAPAPVIQAAPAQIVQAPPVVVQAAPAQAAYQQPVQCVPCQPCVPCY